jgi:hypothetical protein
VALHVREGEAVDDFEVDVALPEIYFDELPGIKTAELAFKAVSDQRFVLELSALVTIKPLSIS